MKLLNCSARLCRSSGRIGKRFNQNRSCGCSSRSKQLPHLELAFRRPIMILPINGWNSPGQPLLIVLVSKTTTRIEFTVAEAGVVTGCCSTLCFKCLIQKYEKVHFSFFTDHRCTQIYAQSPKVDTLRYCPWRTGLPVIIYGLRNRDSVRSMKDVLRWLEIR